MRFDAQCLLVFYRTLSPKCRTDETGQRRTERLVQADAQSHVSGQSSFDMYELQQELKGLAVLSAIGP